jgi:hypothetical protein
MCLAASAQPFLRQTDGIPFQINGVPVRLPLAGGVNSPNHQFVDIDGDTDFDLFVFDNDLHVDFYRNEGSPSVADYRLRNGIIELPPFMIWFLFSDFDGDGLTDMLCEDTTFTGVRVYRNTGSAHLPAFTLFVPSLLDMNGNPVFGGANSTPAPADIDADGDLDFFSSNIVGTVNFYRNTGSPISPLYQFVTDTWQNILIIGDSCTTARPHQLRHGASAFRFADIDADNDLDFFVGDLFHVGVFSITNTGTPNNPTMVCNTSYYPPTSPVVTNGFNQTSFVDIDGDNDLDLFVGVLGGIVQRDGFWFLRNIGSPSSGVFEFATKNYLSVLDVGMNAHPTFVDIDADGDQDLFIGNLNGEISFYRNTGSTTGPAFTRVDSVYQGITGGFSFVPSFVDTDNDGDKDLFVSRFGTSMRFYRNVGTAASAQFATEPSPVDTIPFSQYNANTFADIDADGDTDLFVGTSAGRISFYRNTGSPSTFVPQLESTFYQNITAQNPIPTFSDIDTDGDMDLFLGTSEGRIEYYQNTGTPSNALFVRITNNFGNTEPKTEASPVLVDIDGDSDKDMFIGIYKGGLHFYRNDMITFVSRNHDIPLATRLEPNYPNPFNSTTVVNYELRVKSPVQLVVYDVVGHEVATLADGIQEPGFRSVRWDASSMASGVYFCRLSTTDCVQTRKLVVLR